MRLCVLILLGTAALAFSQTGTDRKAAYGQLRDEARAAELVKEVSGDIDQGRYEAALKKADEASKLQPDDGAVLNARGAALTELHRFDEAEKALTAAVAADPKSFPPQYNLGEVLALQKKYSDAADQFSMLQSRFEDKPILKFKIYLCYALDGRKDDARAALANISSPMDGPAWYYAHAADKLLSGKPAEAKQLITVANAIHQDGIRAYTETLQNTGLLK